MRRLTGSELGATLEAPGGMRDLAAGPPALVVNFSDRSPSAPPAETSDAFLTAPVVVIGVVPGSPEGDVSAAEPARADRWGPPGAEPRYHPASRWCDVLVDDPDGAAEMADAVDAHPTAAVALALLLRGSEGRSTPDGLLLESATYSTLQGSPGHRAWLAERPTRQSTGGTGPVVHVTRVEDRLTVTLARPARRNAYSAQMRDELLAALDVAAADPSVHKVILCGEGPAFSAGGDLDEFGSGSDPGRNHLVRLGHSAAAMLDGLAPRVTSRLHGACIGAGIELPAFAREVIAAPDTSFRLPELAMGLIPGAGGTVSLPRRIGRHRTAWLAFTGRRIDAATALRWGLVDKVEPVDATGWPATPTE